MPVIVTVKYTRKLHCVNFITIRALIVEQIVNHLQGGKDAVTAFAKDVHVFFNEADPHDSPKHDAFILISADLAGLGSAHIQSRAEKMFAGIQESLSANPRCDDLSVGLAVVPTEIGFCESRPALQ